MALRSVILAFVVGSISLVFTANAASTAAGGFTTGIDADATGNSAASLGTADACRSVGAGTAFDVDVWVRDVPQFLGFQFDLHYDPSVLRVTGSDMALLLESGPGAGPVYDVSEFVPDEDGLFTFGAVDPAAWVEAGQGCWQG